MRKANSTEYTMAIERLNPLHLPSSYRVLRQAYIGEYTKKLKNEVKV